MPDKWGPTLQPTSGGDSSAVNTKPPCYGLPPPPNPSSTLRESAITNLASDPLYLSALQFAMQKLNSGPDDSTSTQSASASRQAASLSIPLPSSPPQAQAPRFLLIKRDHLPTASQVPPPLQPPPKDRVQPAKAKKEEAKRPKKDPPPQALDLSPEDLHQAPPAPDLSPEDLQRDFKRGLLLQGKLRILAADPNMAYVTVEGLNVDVLIRGSKNRGRCLEGDEVAVKLMPTQDWFVPGGGGGGGGGRGGQQARRLPKDLTGTPWVPKPITCPEDPDASEPPLLSKEALLSLLQSVATRVKDLSGGRPTGKSVAVLEPSTRREQVVGTLSYSTKLQDQQAASSPTAPLAPHAQPQDGIPLYFLPMDPRLPPCLVTPLSVKSQPEELLSEARSAALNPNDMTLKRTLMSGRVVGWPEGSEWPLVELRASLGQAGEIESETAAILEQEGVRRADFSSEVLACLPSLPWAVRDEDLEGGGGPPRTDFRAKRVFSIDPPTAKDLDDALHVERIAKGRFKIGVHIADVASFIPPYSALDIEAGLRSTSVYLVQRVIPMLPSLLCEELCSLNPGVDRFAFSVVWEVEMDEDDESCPVIIKDRWAGRSVIRSCGKLTYPIVQTMLEGSFDPKRHEPDYSSSGNVGDKYKVHSDGTVSLDKGEMGGGPAKVEIHDGFDWSGVMEDSLVLWKVAKRLRKSRFDSGALRLDNIRLCFKLDKDGNPTSCSHYDQREANQLVEEFMLLANLTVAEIIADAFPSLAMLRRHVEPDKKKMQELVSTSQDHHLGIDTSSSAALQSSLAHLRATCPDPHIVETITMIATRPMQLATYFCTGDVVDREGWRHYALSIGAYTHFTSPIRRYPDVVVHRLLAAALDRNSNSNLTSEDLVSKHQLFSTQLCAKVSGHCNDKRLASRKAQDASLRLYLCCLLRKKPVVTTGVLLQVGGAKYFNVYCPEYGIDCRICTNEGFGISVMAAWNSDTKTLLIDHAEVGVGGGGGGRGSRGGFRGSNSRGRGGRGSGGVERIQGGTTEDATSSPQALDPLFDYRAWIDSIGGKLENPGMLDPVQMPLRLRALVKVPVVLCSVLRPGKISEVMARIYLGAPTAAPQASEDIPSVIQEEVTSSIPYDSLND